MSAYLFADVSGQMNGWMRGWVRFFVVGGWLPEGGVALELNQTGWKEWKLPRTRLCEGICATVKIRHRVST